MLQGDRTKSNLSSSASDEHSMVKQALSGDKESASLLGSRYFKQMDYVSARPWLELASELGDTESTYMMGLLIREQAKQSDNKEEASSANEVIQEIKEARKEARKARKEKKKAMKVNEVEDSMVSLSKDIDSSDSAVAWLRKAAKHITNLLWYCLRIY